MKLLASVVLAACAVTTAYVAGHRPVKTVTEMKQVEVVKEKYVLSPDGKTGDVLEGDDDDKPKPTTAYNVIADWTTPQTEQHYGNGFMVAEVDGQRCIMWSRVAPGFNGDETASGMSCRPIPPR